MNEMEDRFEIDLSNPAELAAKAPELRRLYEEKIQERKMLDEQIELLRRLVIAATGIVRAATPTQHENPEPPPARVARRRRAAPAQERAVAGLKAFWEKTGSAAGPTSLYKFMTASGMDVPKSANLLGVNLWDAWQAGRIMKAPNGVYRPLDGTGRTECDQPLTDYYHAAELGFPAP
jgi:hypothetical protein